MSNSQHNTDAQNTQGTPHPARLRVFLCHARMDQAAVMQLYQRLEDDGFEPWMDKKNLIPGVKWQPQITKAVKNADVALICLSADAVNKQGYLQREIKLALDVAEDQPEGAIWIVPVRLLTTLQKTCASEAFITTATHQPEKTPLEWAIPRSTNEAAILVVWVWLLPTMLQIIAVSTWTWRALWPVGFPNSCISAACMARYRRRASLIVSLLPNMVFIPWREHTRDGARRHVSIMMSMYSRT